MLGAAGDRSRGTLRLLADRAVELELVGSLSHETVRRTLKKNGLKLWRRLMWCIPPGQDAAFVARMERVLDLCARPCDARRPVVRMDEQPHQLLSETRAPLPARPGRAAADHEYVRVSSGARTRKQKRDGTLEPTLVGR